MRNLQVSQSAQALITLRMIASKSASITVVIEP